MSVAKITLKLGKSLEIFAKDGVHYKIETADGAPFPNASVSTRKGDDLVIHYADGSIVVLRGFYLVASEVDLDGDAAQLADVTSEGQSKAPAEETIVNTQGDRASVAQLLASNSSLQHFAENFGQADIGMGLLALAPLALAGGGGHSSGGAPSTATTLLRGSVVAGPVAAGNDLIVNVYTADGVLLSQVPAVLGSDGQFVVEVGSYLGPAIIVVTSGGDSVLDYLDEATGTLKDLEGGIFTVINLVEGENAINVNPLTTLAGMSTGVTLIDGVPHFARPITTATITAAATAIAQAFGLTGDILTQPVIPALIFDANGAAIVNQNANSYGAILAALSGLDAQSGDDSTGLAALQAQVTAGGLTDVGKAILLAAADSVESGAIDRATIIALLDASAAGAAAGLGSTLSETEIASLTLLVAASLTPAQLASIVDLASLPTEFFAVLAPEALAAVPLTAFSTAQIGQLSSAQVAALAAAGAFASVGGSIVAQLPTGAVAGLPISVIQSMTAADVQALTAAQVQGLAPSQLAALDPVQIAAMTPAAIVGLSPADIAALTSAQVAALTAAQLEALAASGDLAGLTASQLGLMAPELLTCVPTSVLETLSAAQIESLTTAQVSALLPAQLAALTPAAIVGLTPADVAALTAAQVSALTAPQMSALAASGDLSGLTPAQIGAVAPAAMGSLPASALASLNAAQIEALSAEQLAALVPVQIAAIPDASIVGLAPADVTALTPAQVAALTSAQVAALAASSDLAGLTAAQIDALSPAAIGAVPAAMIGALTSQNIDDLTTAQLVALTAEQLTALGAAGVTPANLDAVHTAIQTASTGVEGLSGTAQLLSTVAAALAAPTPQSMTAAQAQDVIEDYLAYPILVPVPALMQAIGLLFPNADLSTPFAYRNALSTGTYVDRTAPTLAELQTVVTRAGTLLTTALAELTEDLGGNANGVALNPMQASLLSPNFSFPVQYGPALVTASNYANPAHPTLAEAQAVIASLNTTYIATRMQSIATALLPGALPLDVLSLSPLIPGAGNLLNANQAAFRTAFSNPSNYSNPSAPTLAEVTQIFEQVKPVVLAVTLSEIAEDIAGNANGQPLTAQALNAILSTGNIASNERMVANALDSSHYANPAAPTLVEVQNAIKQLSAAVSLVRTELPALVAGTAPAGSFTAADLSVLVTGVDPSKMPDYINALQHPVSPWTPVPSSVQIQSLVTQVNQGIYGLSPVFAALAEDIAGNADNNAVQSYQLTQAGVTHLGYSHWATYRVELLDATNYANPARPTKVEVQAVITAVNETILASLMPALATQLASNYPNNGVLSQISQIMPGVSDLYAGQYQPAFYDRTNYADIAAPTLAEVRAILLPITAAMDRIVAGAVTTMNTNASPAAVTLADMQLVTQHVPDSALQIFIDRLYSPSNYNPGNFPNFVANNYAATSAVSSIDLAFRGLNELALRVGGDPIAVNYYSNSYFPFEYLGAGLNNEVGTYNAWYSVKARDASHYANPSVPTFAELQVIVDQGNQTLPPIYARILAVLNGTAAAATVTLADLQVLSDHVTADNANLYRAEIFDLSRYNGDLVNNVFNRVIDGVKTADTAVAALSDLAVSITSGLPLVDFYNELAPVLTNIESPNIHAYQTQLMARGNYADPNHPTFAELQAFVDHVNNLPAVIAEILEDQSGNSNATPISLAALQSISAEIQTPWLALYQADLADPNRDIPSVTAYAFEAIYAAIEGVNRTQALAALAIDLVQGNSTEFSVNFIRMVAENINQDLLPSYLTALHVSSNFVDTAHPTAAETQAVIDRLNAELVQARLVEDMAGNQDGLHPSALELQLVLDNVSGAQLETYLDVLTDPTSYATPGTPLVSEMQAAVNAVNAEAAVELGLTRLGLHFTAPAAMAFLYNFQFNNLEEIVPGISWSFRTNYLSRVNVAANYADPAHPTLAEVQGLVSAADAEIATVVTEIYEDFAGNSDGELLSLAQLMVLNDSINPIDLDYHRAALAQYAATTPQSNVSLEHLVNISHGVSQTRDTLRAALVELVEDIGGNQNAVPFSIGNFHSLADNLGRYSNFAYDAWADLIKPELVDGSNYADPTAPTQQEIHAVVDAAFTQAYLTGLSEALQSGTAATFETNGLNVLQLDAFSSYMTSPYSSGYNTSMNQMVFDQVGLAANYPDLANITLAQVEAAIQIGWRNYVYQSAVNAGTASLSTWHSLGLTNLTAGTLAAFEADFYGRYVKSLAIAVQRADVIADLYALADGTAGNAVTDMTNATAIGEAMGYSYNVQGFSTDANAQAAVPAMLLDIYDRLNFAQIDTLAERAAWGSSIGNHAFTLAQYHALGFTNAASGDLTALNTRVFRLPPTPYSGPRDYTDVYGDANSSTAEITHVPSLASLATDFGAVQNPITVDISANSTTLGQGYATYTVQFSEAVTGFELQDIMVQTEAFGSNITLSDFTTVNSSTYTFRINDMFGADGATTVWLNIDAMSGAAGFGILGGERSHQVDVAQDIHVVSTSLNGSNEQSASDDIELNFNDYMTYASIGGSYESSIYLLDTTTNNLITYEASNFGGKNQSSQVSFGGTTLSIDATSDLIVGHSYILSLGENAVQGAQDNGAFSSINAYDESLVSTYDYQLSFTVV